MYPSLLPESEDEDLVDSTRPVSDLVKIRQWLQPTPYDLEPNEYSRHRASHLVGTGKWLTSTKTYRQWHSGDNGLLWIKGIPGSGKSVMAASIIDQLQQENVPVLYFFFRQIIDANHRPIAALRDWLCQILSYSSPLQGKLKGYLGRRLESLSPSDFWKDLKLALESFPRVYCVTDALDEMDEGNDGFLHSLAELGEWRPSNVSPNNLTSGSLCGDVSAKVLHSTDSIGRAIGRSRYCQLRPVQASGLIYPQRTPEYHRGSSSWSGEWSISICKVFDGRVSRT